MLQLQYFAHRISHFALATLHIVHLIEKVRDKFVQIGESIVLIAQILEQTLDIFVDRCNTVSVFR